LQEVKQIFSDFRGRWDMNQLLYSLADAWATLGVSRSTLYELIAAGDIEAVKVGRRTLIRHDELERYVQGLPARTADEMSARAG
jgi:excisionase family DNA binding protein